MEKVREFQNKKNYMTKVREHRRKNKLKVLVAIIDIDILRKRLVPSQLTYGLNFKI